MPILAAVTTIDLIGYTAGGLTTVAFVPQVYRLYKHKSADDISIPTFTLFGMGVAFWFAYGLLKSDGPMMLWNGITLLLALGVVSLTIRYRRANRDAISSE